MYDIHCINVTHSLQRPGKSAILPASQIAFGYHCLVSVLFSLKSVVKESLIIHLFVKEMQSVTHGRSS